MAVRICYSSAQKMSPQSALTQVKLFHLVFAFMATLTFTGCVPKDTPLPTALSSLLNGTAPTYDGFTGVLSAETQSSTKVKLTWTASTSTKVAAYNIYDTTFLFAPKLIKTVKAPATMVTLTGLTPQLYYRFRVRAADATNVEDGNTVDVPAIPYGGVHPAIVQGSTSAMLIYDDASNSDQVNIYCDPGVDAPKTLVAQVKDVTLTQKVIDGLTAGTKYTCRVAVMINDYIDNNTVTTTFTPLGTASQLVFAVQPGSAVAGTNFSPQPVIKILDVNGNTVSAGPDSTTVINLVVSTASPTSGTLLGSFNVAAVGGVATFSGLKIQEAGLKILTARKGDTSTLSFGSPPLAFDSNQFTISPAGVSPATSTLTIGPTGPLVANGTAYYTVSFKLLDQYNNPVPGVTPRFISSNTNDILTQPIRATDATGTVTGSVATTVVGGPSNNGQRNLSISSPSGLTSVIVSAVYVPGPATQLAFTQQPLTSPAGIGGMTSNVVVSIQDANGNLIAPSDPTSSAQIQVLLAAGPAGAVLSGTTSVTSSGGVATFIGLGIDKTGTNYKFKAAAPSFPTLLQPNSYPFNITSASPTKIAITAGTSTLTSSTLGTTVSVCGTYTIQTQDGGGNPSNATTNMAITLASTKNGGAQTGSAIFYNSSNCSGSAVTQIPLTTGRNTATVSMRDPAAETIVVTANSVGVTPGTFTVQVSPSQYTLAGGPVNTLSGQCSAGFTLSTLGANGLAGPVTADTAFLFSFLSSGTSTNAIAFSDSNCTTSLGASPATATILSGTSATTVYFKDNTAEGPITVAVNPQNGMTSAVINPGAQTVTFLASLITFVAPITPMVAGGPCVGPFLVKVKDAAANVVTSSSNVLNINGVSGTSGAFTSSACTGSPVTQVTMSSGAASLWFKDSTVETLSLNIADPTAAPLKMTASSVSTIITWPYQLGWTTPTGATSLTTGPISDGNPNAAICLPMTVQSQYSSGGSIAPLSSVLINLTGAGVETTTGASYYSDSACTNQIVSKTLPAGTASVTVYFMALSPGPYTLGAADAVATLQPSSNIATTVVGDKAWIGTRAGGPNVGNGFTFSFATGKVPVSARQDGNNGAWGIHFDSTKRYLFTVDFNNSRILKYDYLNGTFIGWIGGLFTYYGNQNYVPTTGGATGCASMTQSAQQTPGWCTGGASQAYQPQTFGSLYNPTSITDDGYNLYVSNYNGASVTMYNMNTGAYEGWIGSLNNAATPYVPSGAQATLAAGVAASSANPSGATLANACASTAVGAATPGFCLWGNNDNSGAVNNGIGGRIYASQAILWANNVLYVASNGMVSRFDGTPGSATHGKSLGWIGWVSSTGPSNIPTSCVGGSAVANTQTPGWCTGGKAVSRTPITTGGISNPQGLYADVPNDWLYIVDASRISRYHLSTGAFDSLVNATGLTQPYQIVNDGSNFYVADWTRLLRLDSTAAGLTGWVGKISTPPTSPAACSGKYTFDNTPAWCLNGTGMPGMDEQSFNALTGVEYDGNGYLITSQRLFPAIKKWNATTGAYVGQMVVDSQSPVQWATSREYSSGQGYDDASLNVPMGMVTDPVNKVMYVVEQQNSRVKKISTVTGQTLGSIGGITTLPTGGDTVCTQLGAVSAMSASPGWCLGALPNPNYLWGYGMNMISQNAPGVMNAPTGITMDSTYLYITDVSWHRIHRFYISSGVYAGWIGWVSSTPTGGAAGCTTTSTGFTPGWCIGGASTSNNTDGGMTYPTGIWQSGGFLYVVDYGNKRVGKYSVAGVFQGWIGRMGTNSASCTTVVNTNTYTKGWCKGSGGVSSTATIGANNGDPGGGFAFFTNSNIYYAGISGDSTYIYVSHDWNNRIDRFYINANAGTGVVAGQYGGSLNTKYTLPLPASGATWTMTPGAWGDVGWNGPTGFYPTGLYVDAANDAIYYTANEWSVVKRKLSDGSFIGWQGAIQNNNNPTACTPSGTMIGFTPGWCQGGGAVGGYSHGMFAWAARFISGDSNFIYVTDVTNQRVSRIPR